MEALTGTAALAIIAAAIAPFVTALLNNPDTPAARKRIVAAVVALTLGLLSALLTQQFVWVSDDAYSIIENVVISVGLVMSLGQGFYKLFEGTVKNLEESTSPGVAEEEPDEEPMALDDDPPEEPQGA